jgi:hypothetical protein
MKSKGLLELRSSSGGEYNALTLLKSSGDAGVLPVPRSVIQFQAVVWR